MNDVGRCLSLLRSRHEKNSSSPSTNDAVQACRTLTELLCSLRFREGNRENPDYRKVLSLSTSGLLKLLDDEALQVWSVADECLLALIKTLIRHYPTRLLTELVKSIRYGPGRTQRIALERFSILCDYVNPQKGRNFVTPLLEAFEKMANSADSMLWTSMGTAMDSICAHLIYYMEDSEVKRLIQVYLPVLASSEASTRRAASQMISALCHYSPQPLYGFTIALLVSQFSTQAMQQEINPDAAPPSTAQWQGLLYCATQLIRVAHPDGSSPPVCSQDPLSPYLASLTSLYLQGLTSRDHNVVAGSLELVNVILATYQGSPFEEKGWTDTVTQILQILLPLVLPSEGTGSQSPDRASTPRISIVAMSLQVLGWIILYHRSLFLSALPPPFATSVAVLLQGTSHEDPLLRGKTLFLASCLLIARLEEQHTKERNTTQEHESSPLDCDRLQVKLILHEMMQGIQDSSSVTSQESCRAFHLLQPYLEETNHASTLLSAYSQLTNQCHPYWLIRCEVLQLVARAPMALLADLQRRALQQATPSRDRLTLYSRHSLQSVIITFLMKHLEDEDWRVVEAASHAIANILPRLCDESPLQREGTFFLLPEVQQDLAPFATRCTLEEDSIQRHGPLIMKGLLHGLNLGDSDTIFHGYCHATKSVFTWIARHERSPGSWVLQWSGVYASEIVPLLLTRLTGSGIITDLDIHTTIIALFGAMFLPSQPTLDALHGSDEALTTSPAPSSPRFHLPPSLRLLWKAVFTHLMRLLMLFANLEFATEPLVVNERTTSPYIGSYASFPVYVSLFNTLYKQKQETVVTTLEPSKTERLLETVLVALSGVVRCAGKDCSPYAEELLSYLHRFVKQFPLPVSQVLAELFLACGSDSLPLHRSSPAPTTSLTRSWSESQLSTIHLGQSPQQRLHSRMERSIIRNYRKCSVKFQTSSGTTLSPSLSLCPSFDHLWEATQNIPLPNARHSPSRLPRLGEPLSSSQTTPDVRMKDSSNSTSTSGNRGFRSLFRFRGEQSIQAKIEFLMKRLMEMYLLSHDGALHQSVLYLAIQLESYGIHLSSWEKEGRFLSFLHSQAKGERAFLKDLPGTLPFILILTIRVMLTQKQLDIPALQKLTAYALQEDSASSSASPSAVSQGLQCLYPLIFHLFAVSWAPSVRERGEKVCQYFLDQLVSQLPRPSAAQGVLVILQASQTYQTQDHYERNSRVVFDALLGMWNQMETPALLDGQDADDSLWQEIVRHLDGGVIDLTRIVETIGRVNESTQEDWLLRLVPLVYCLVGEARRQGHECIHTLFDEPSLPHLLLQALERAWSSYHPALVLRSVREKNWRRALHRLLQYSIFLLSSPTELSAPSLLLLQSLVRRVRTSHDATLHVLLFQLIRTLAPCDQTFWSELAPQRVREYTKECQWASWKSDFFHRLSITSFCAVLFPSSPEGQNDALLEKAFESPVFLRGLLWYTRERQVQHLLRILPHRQVSQLMDYLVDLFHSPSGEGTNETRPSSRLLPVEYILVFLLIPCGSFPLMVNMVGLMAYYTKHYVLSFSSRKLIRYAMRHVLEIMRDHHDRSFFSPSLVSTLRAHLETLQVSVVYRQGSDHVQVLRDALALLDAPTPDQGEENPFQDSPPATTPTRSEAEESTVTYGMSVVVDAYRQGTLVSLVGLASLSLSTLLELMASNQVQMDQVERFILDPQGLPAYQQKQDLTSSGTPTSPPDLLTFSSPSSPSPDTVMDAILSYYQRHLLACRDTSKFTEITRVSQSLVQISQTSPGVVEQVVRACGLNDTVQVCQHAMQVYITGEHWRTRRHASESLHTLLHLFAFTWSVFELSLLQSWVEEHPESYQSLITTLFQLHQLAMQESELILPSLSSNTVSSLDWEMQQPQDVLGDLLVSMLLPSLSFHASLVTPRDSRPATRFQFLHGLPCLHAYIDVLTTLLRTLHPHSVYPTVTEEAGEFFLDTPLRALGMTSSDQELLQSSLPLLPSMFVRDEEQLDHVLRFFQTILQSSLAGEPLQSTACQGLTLLVQMVEYVTREQVDKPTTRTPTSSKAEFFLSSGQGVKLLELQAILEPLQLWVHHLGYPRDRSMPFPHARTMQAHHASFLNVPWDSRVDDVTVPRSPLPLRSFLLQHRYAWIRENHVLSSLATTSADLLLGLAASSVHEDRGLIFLRQQCLRALLHLCHLLSLDHLQALLQLATTVSEQDAPGDTYGVQLAVMASARALACCKQHSRITPSFLTPHTNALVPRIRRCLESGHASSHVAGLHAISLLMKHQLYEVITPLLPFLFPYTLRILRGSSSSPSVPPEKEIRDATQVQSAVMEVVFALLEKYTREAEQHHFTRPALEAMMQWVEDPRSPTFVDAIFRGLHGLLVSFSLSHAQRTMVRSCALQYLPSSLFLPALRLMLTCMYTGDQNDGPPSSPEDSDQLVQMDNVERAKILFHKLHHGLAREAQGVAQILPHLLCDFFAMDQVLSLVLGEFVRTKQAQRPQLIARVLFDVIQQYHLGQPEMMNVILKWICLCLKNFIQMEPLTYSKWAITCLFMTVSPSPTLRALYAEVADSYPHAPLQDSLFLQTALDFYRHPNLSTRRRESFLIIFDTPHPVYQQLVSLCRNLPREQTPDLPDP